MTTLDQASDNIMSNVSDVANSASRTASSVVTGAHDAIDRAAAAAVPAVERIAVGAHTAVDKASSVASKTAQAISSTSGQIRDAQSRLADACTAQMKENPMVTLGVAVAAGFVLSRLLSSR